MAAKNRNPGFQWVIFVYKLPIILILLKYSSDFEIEITIRIFEIMADDSLKLDLTGKKKKAKKPIILEELTATDENKKIEGDSEELVLGLKKKKKVKSTALTTTTTENEIKEEKGAEEKLSKFDELSNLIDAKHAWPDYTYDELIHMIFDIIKEKNPELTGNEKKKFLMKPPQIARAGSKKTAFANFAEICRLLKREPKHVYRFIIAELGTNGSVDGNNCLIIKGRFQQKHFESVLRKYIKEYVTCHTCHSSDTQLIKDTRLFFLECKTCGSRCSVSTIKSGFTAMVTKRAAARRAAEVTAGK